MSEQFILAYIPYRMKQLGVTNYYIKYKHMLIPGLADWTIPAYNDLYFVVDQPPFIIVESDYGIFSPLNFYNVDNTYEHRGEISIRNINEPNQRVKFIQVIMVD